MAHLCIAVAGAGIGGLAAAAALADRGHDVTVFDRFPAPRPVGSGLVIQPVGLSVLDRIGVGDDVRDHGNRIYRMLGHEAETGTRVLDVRYDRNGGRRYGLAIHRAALFDALYRAVLARGIPVQMDAPVSGRAGQTLLVRDDPAGRFDLIVDALGAGSTLSHIRSRPLPYGAIWGTVDWPDTDLPPNQLSQMYRRADRMLGVLPIGTLPGDPTPKAAVFWSLPATDHNAWRTAGLAVWKAEARALWPAFAPFLDQITDPDQMTMARYGHGTLARPYGGGMVHIGDAAHRASPQLGQGANMALLDAFALARALDLHPLPDALRAYAMARRWHVRVYQAFSAAFTPQYQSDSRILPLLRDKALFPLSQIWPLPRVLTSLVCGSMIPPLGSLTDPAD